MKCMCTQTHAVNTVCTRVCVRVSVCMTMLSLFNIHRCMHALRTCIYSLFYASKLYTMPIHRLVVIYISFGLSFIAIAFMRGKFYRAHYQIAKMNKLKLFQTVFFYYYYYIFLLCAFVNYAMDCVCQFNRISFARTKLIGWINRVSSMQKQRRCNDNKQMCV